MTAQAHSADSLDYQEHPLEGSGTVFWANEMSTGQPSIISLSNLHLSTSNPDDHVIVFRMAQKSFRVISGNANFN